MSDPCRSPVVRSFSLPNGSKIASLRESTLRAGLKAASLALKTERALNQTYRVHWTLLDPEATDGEMLRMDDEGYVEVPADRVGGTAELIALLRKFFARGQAFVWLTSTQELFGDAIPLDMIAMGRVDELVRVLRQMDGGVYL